MSILTRTPKPPAGRLWQCIAGFSSPPGLEGLVAHIGDVERSDHPLVAWAFAHGAGATFYLDAGPATDGLTTADTREAQTAGMAQRFAADRLGDTEAPVDVTILGPIPPERRRRAKTNVYVTGGLGALAGTIVDSHSALYKSNPSLFEEVI